MMKLRRFGFVLLALAWGAATPGPAAAEDFGKEAGTFVQTLGDQAIAIITDAGLSAGDREKRFHEMFVSSFDVPAIARFVLGRYWRTASDPQKDEFLKLFEDMIVKTYNNRFKDYKGEQFVITGTRGDGDSAMVSTNVVSAQVRNGQAVKVDWRVLRPQGKLKIVDVIIEGVSMSLTQQQEFGSVIQRNGGQIDGLLATMRERIQQQSQAARG